MKRIGFLLAGLLACLVLLGGFRRQQMTAQDIISRSLKAHGGVKLSDWKSMTIQGTVDMSDGIIFRAAYLVFAQAPGKLRVEKDMTAAQGGRLFYEYFMNNGVAWSRRNLIPERGNLEDMKRWMGQCYGVAHYARNAESLTRKEDAVVEWREKPDLQSGDFKVVATRPAYVVTAVIGKSTADLYIDKESFYFLQEISGRSKRIFWNFKKFGEVILPTRILEISGTTQRETITPYTYDSVKFNVPIEDWLFTEDMPKTKVVK